jgi:hypothetical protein
MMFALLLLLPSSRLCFCDAFLFSGTMGGRFVSFAALLHIRLVLTADDVCSSYRTHSPVVRIKIAADRM